MLSFESNYMKFLQILNSWISRVSGLLMIKDADATRLRIFEVGFTLQYTVWMGMLFLNPEEWLGQDGFHISLADQNKGYWEPWPRLSLFGLYGFGVVLYCGVIMILANRLRRLGLWLVLACAIYVQYADTPSAFSVSRLNIIVFAILATAPPPWQDDKGRMRQSLGPVRLCQALMIMLYFTAGVAKVKSGDWLEYDDVIWSHTQGVYRTEFAAWLVREMPMSYWTLQKWLALSFEMGAPFLFCFHRLRPLGLILGLGFHLTIALCFWSIWPFSLHMVTYYLLFLPTRWQRQFYEFGSALKRSLRVLALNLKAKAIED